MLNIGAAQEILHKNVSSLNLRRHCYAVSCVMGALAVRLGKSEEKIHWEIAGLLHDADYEITKNSPEMHTKLVLEWLKEYETNQGIEGAILAHGWGYVKGNPEPKTQMEWALYICDELTGLIVAVALVKPDKKLSSVNTDSVMNKWDEKSFAKGVNREQIKACEARLGIPLREFVGIALTSMQNIAQNLGL